MQIKGNITYNGDEFDKFCAQRTAAYIAQVSLSVTILLGQTPGTGIL